MPYADKKDKAAHDKMYGKKTVGLRVKRNKARRRELQKGKEARKEARKEGRPLTEGEKKLAVKGDNTHTDHKVALSKGGGNGEGNTRTISAEDNLKKYDKAKA